jgi:hypothetical protein
MAVERADAAAPLRRDDLGSGLLRVAVASDHNAAALGFRSGVGLLGADVSAAAICAAARMKTSPRHAIPPHVEDFFVLGGHQRFPFAFRRRRTSQLREVRRLIEGTRPCSRPSVEVLLPLRRRLSL